MGKTNEHQILNSGDLVSVLSHQIKTPLTGMKWYIELLQKDADNKLSRDQKYYLNKLQQSNTRIISLVDNILHTSRLGGTSGLKINKSETDIVAEVNNIIEDEFNYAGAKKIKISVESQLPKGFTIRVDKEKIDEVLRNLINNAVKYSRIRGKVMVKIEIEMNQDNLLITVKDEGIGIPKDQQSQVFVRFFRGSNAISMETEGSGLGLFIARSIVEAHGGTITFDSEEDKGTTFYVRLPLVS